MEYILTLWSTKSKIIMLGISSLNFPSTRETFEKTKTDLLSYLQENNDVVVRNHCHITGRFRGAAHQYCNLQFRKNHELPCLFHNFTVYDSHHIMKALEGYDINKLEGAKVRVLA